MNINSPIKTGNSARFLFLGILTREDLVHVEVVPDAQAKTLLGLLSKIPLRTSRKYR